MSNDSYGRELECKDIIQFALNIIRKLSLVNETLRPETETRLRRLTFSPRQDRDRDVPTFHRDRDVGKMRLETVSRPRHRDRDYIPAYRKVVKGSRMVTSPMTSSDSMTSQADITTSKCFFFNNVRSSFNIIIYCIYCIVCLHFLHG